MNDFKKFFSEFVGSTEFDPQEKEVCDEIMTALNVCDIPSLKNRLKRKRLLEKATYLNLLVLFIEQVLEDKIISSEELLAVKNLKRLLNIKEGDLFEFRKSKIQVLLSTQFEMIYQDNKVDHFESLYSVQLQELFDLSFDQFEELKKNEVLKAIERGADPSDLDYLFRK